MDDASIPIKSKDFWFEDGDIVLRVTEDGAENHFRVHRPILTIASPVFDDMLSMPQPPHGDSLPVPLREDSAQDVASLLGALYNARKTQIVTFDVALSILRLSHKYQIEGLQQGIKLKLLERWLLKSSEYLAGLTLFGSPEDRMLQTVKVIEIAQHCGVNEPLPTAFYELSCVRGTLHNTFLLKM